MSIVLPIFKKIIVVSYNDWQSLYLCLYKLKLIWTKIIIFFSGITRCFHWLLRYMWSWFPQLSQVGKTATISHSTSIVIQTCTQLAVSRQNTITVQRTGYSTLNAGECTPFLVPCIVAGLVCNSLIYLFLYVS